jgi:hypothetical protein
MTMIKVMSSKTISAAAPLAEAPATIAPWFDIPRSSRTIIIIYIEVSVLSWTKQ